MDNNNLYIRKNMHHTTVTLLVTSLVAVLVIFISIGYSAISASLKVSGDLKYEASEELYSIIAKSSKGLDTNINFGVAPTAATSGVYKMNSTKNDKYPVYYYRGIVSNNNIKFAGFCWKMVRTTDTGGIKIIYNGKPKSDGSCYNFGQLGESTFNDCSNGYDCEVGYTYTHDDYDSTIKMYIENWFYSSSINNMSALLEDTVWCNDKNGLDSTQSINYEIFPAHKRLVSSPYQPSIECSQANDRYTVSKEKGNGLLRYPVALLTADEATLAGHGWSGYTNSGYLYADKGWWTMSPSGYSNDDTAYMFIVNSLGKILNYSVDDSNYGVRPAVSLQSGIMVNPYSGDGSYSNPYQIIGG